MSCLRCPHLSITPGHTVIACLSPGCQKLLTKIPSDLLFTDSVETSVLTSLTSPRYLTFHHPYLLKLTPPSVSMIPLFLIFLPLFWSLLELSSWLLRLPLPSMSMGPTAPHFTVCHSTHPPGRAHHICGFHHLPHADISQIHGSSSESTLEPHWTPLEHSTSSSREPKPILVFTPILENQTHRNKKTLSACILHLN